MSSLTRIEFTQAYPFGSVFKIDSQGNRVALTQQEYDDWVDFSVGAWVDPDYTDTDIRYTNTSGDTIAGNLTVEGNLTVNGQTTTVTSNTVTIKDPIFTLGGSSAATSDDNKDRGIEFRWHNGTSAKTGFFGFDDSTGKFTFLPDATNSSEVFSGSKGTLDATIEWSDVLNKPDPVITVTLTGDVTGTANTTLTDLANGTVTVATTISSNSVALGSDTTGNYVASIAGTANQITVTGSGSETAAVTLGLPSVINVDITGNSATSNTSGKWATARTITLGGDLSGSVSIDGSANATLVATVSDNSHSHTILNIDGLQDALDNKLDIGGNVATASKLQTARTISLIGDLSGSVSFDGDSNVSLVANIVNPGMGRVSELSDLDSDTGINVEVTPDSDKIEFIASGLKKAEINISGLSVTGQIQSTDIISAVGLIGSLTGDVYSQDTTPIKIIDSVNKVITGDLTGNASTATKWQNARTINLTGDVQAAGVSFDGTGNVTLNTTISDGSITSAKLDGDYTNTLYVDSVNNRVGIGTSSPDTAWPLTVHGGSVVLTGNGETVSTSTYNAGFYFKDTSEGFAGQLGFISGEDQDFYIHNNAQGNIRFSAAGVNNVAMVIESTTNRVGIGTISPTVALDVVGTAKIGSLDVTGAAILASASVTTASTSSNLVRNIRISTSLPTGGSDGDVWMVYS